jgi:anti-anti-sigma regulatory factor
MLRITKAFENDSTSIYRVEGKITEESLGVWAEEISALHGVTGRQVILDFSHLWSICPNGVKVLVEAISNGLYFMNCPMEVRNVLHAAGLSNRMLE